MARSLIVTEFSTGDKREKSNQDVTWYNDQFSPGYTQLQFTRTGHRFSSSMRKILSNIGNCSLATPAMNLQWENSMVGCSQGRTRVGTCKSEKNID